MFDRIRELRRVRARDLVPHPLNWRLHPPGQKAALQCVLKEVGFAGALLAREREDGRLELIDGHLRAETVPDALVPVLVLDVDEREAELLLATHDPLAGMAEVDDEQFAELLRHAEPASRALEMLLADLDRQFQTGAFNQPPAGKAPDQSAQLRARYEIVVECRDEDEQAELLEQLTHEGRKCRALIA